MKPTEFSQLARRLMSQPAAPYHEGAVSEAVREICREENLDCAPDRFGNLLVRFVTAPRVRPLVLAAHLDHPGFEMVRPLSPRRWLARFLGGVPAAYFRAGQPLRLQPGDVPARLGKPGPREREFEITAAAAPAESPRFAVWDLEPFARRGSRIHGRACDDLIGAACALAALIDLKRQRARANVIAVLSRAEEDGFRGALALAADKGLPDDALVISLETSRELPPVRQGQGVILRVGDKASIFDSAATRFFHEVALEWQTSDGGFRFQRALMSGGTCEATAYQEFGYRSAALCVALGNYHNCGPRGRIAAEHVSRADAVGMVELLVAAARRMPAFVTLTGRLPRRLEKLLREGRRRLRARSRRNAE